jgi:outer membrane protein
MRLTSRVPALHLVAVTLLLFFFSFFVRAEETSSGKTSLGLSRCVSLVLRQNLELKAQREELNMVKARETESISYGKPRLNLQNIETMVEKTTQIQDFSIGKKKTNISKLVLKQPLYSFGRLEAGIEMLREQRHASEYALQAKREEVVLKAITAYLETLKAQNRARIARETRNVVQEHLDLVETQFKAGVVLSTDVSATRVRLLEARQQVLEEENGFDLSRQALADLLVMSLETPFLLEELPTGDPATLAGVGELPEPSASPEIQKIDRLIQAQEQMLVVEKKMRLPTIGLQASYDTGNQFNDNFKSWNAVVLVDLPVYDSGQQGARIRANQAEINKAGHQRDQALRGLQLVTRQNALKIRELEQKLDLGREALKAATENLEQNRINYRQGTCINTDVLQAHLLLNSARLNFNNAFYEYLVHQAGLYKNIGRLETFVQKSTGFGLAELEKAGETP